MPRFRPVRRGSRWTRRPRTPNGLPRHEDHLRDDVLPESSHVPRGLR